MIKYADDSYLLIPSANSKTVASEIEHVSAWAATCNLKLNQAKIREMIVRRLRKRIAVDLPNAIPGLTRVESLNILGVTLSEHLIFDKHLNSISIKARQSLYTLRVLVAHGLTGPSLSDVVSATTVARMLYAAPVWWGFVGQEG